MPRCLLPLLSSLALAALLSACGGGGDDADGQGGGTSSAADLPCDTALFAADAVVKPSADQLAAYAGTYEGNEGNVGPNPGDPLVQTGTATLVVNADGSVRYKGTAYTPVSVCLDKAPGPFGTLLYVHTDKAHIDIADKPVDTLGQAWGISLADPSLLFRGGVKR